MSDLHNDNHILRLAKPEDARVIGESIYSLLRELGGPGPQFVFEDACEAANKLSKHPELGFAFIIEDLRNKNVIGVATVSSVHALRAGGLYGVLQELWVDPDYRSMQYGQELLNAVYMEADSRGWPMVEVTLPNDEYREIKRLKAFYESCQYMESGTRHRRRM